MINRTLISKFKTLDALIGKTPLAEIVFDYKGKTGRVYAKLESYNYTGSIKDRIAVHMLKKAYISGQLEEGDTICEGTSGNTGIALSAVGSFLGHKVVIYMPDWMTAERIRLIKGFGADVRLVSKEQGGFCALPGLCRDFAKNSGVFLTDQFSNANNTEAHFLTTGEEIVHQMKGFKRLPDAFVAGVGTGGTAVGIGQRLKQANPKLKIHPLEPDNSLSMSGGKINEPHFIYGIGDGFVPEIARAYQGFDDVITVNQTDAVLASQMLAKTLGLGVGISSGANFLGAVKTLETIGFDKTVVTVFADDNKKYLTSEYAQTFSFEEKHLSKDIKLLDLNVVR